MGNEEGRIIKGFDPKQQINNKDEVNLKPLSNKVNFSRLTPVTLE
jgi:hypothetical protein